MREFSASSYEEFAKKYPEGSPGYENVTFVLGFYELVASLLTFGLLHEDLWFDIGFGFDQVWKRVDPIIPGWQKAVSAVLWENTVWMASRSKEWAKDVWKPGLKWKMKAQ